jgi:hypothetical protein
MHRRTAHCTLVREVLQESNAAAVAAAIVLDRSDGRHVAMRLEVGLVLRVPGEDR